MGMAISTIPNQLSFELVGRCAGDALSFECVWLYKSFVVKSGLAGNFLSTLT